MSVKSILNCIYTSLHSTYKNGKLEKLDPAHRLKMITTWTKKIPEKSSILDIQRILKLNIRVNGVNGVQVDGKKRKSKCDDIVLKKTKSGGYRNVPKKKAMTRTGGAEAALAADVVNPVANGRSRMNDIKRKPIRNVSKNKKGISVIDRLQNEYPLSNSENPGKKTNIFQMAVDDKMQMIFDDKVIQEMLSEKQHSVRVMVEKEDHFMKNQNNLNSIIKAGYAWHVPFFKNNIFQTKIVTQSLDVFFSLPATSNKLLNLVYCMHNPSEKRNVPIHIINLRKSVAKGGMKGGGGPKTKSDRRPKTKSGGTRDIYGGDGSLEGWEEDFNAQDIMKKFKEHWQKQGKKPALTDNEIKYSNEIRNYNKRRDRLVRGIESLSELGIKLLPESIDPFTEKYVYDQKQIANTTQLESTQTVLYTAIKRRESLMEEILKNLEEIEAIITELIRQKGTTTTLYQDAITEINKKQQKIVTMENKYHKYLQILHQVFPDVPLVTSFLRNTVYGLHGAWGATNSLTSPKVNTVIDNINTDDRRKLYFVTLTDKNSVAKRVVVKMGSEWQIDTGVQMEAYMYEQLRERHDYIMNHNNTSAKVKSEAHSFYTKNILKYYNYGITKTDRVLNFKDEHNNDFEFDFTDDLFASDEMKTKLLGERNADGVLVNKSESLNTKFRRRFYFITELNNNFETIHYHFDGRRSCSEAHNRDALQEILNVHLAALRIFGFYHGDLKPDNSMIGVTGNTIKIFDLDFSGFVFEMESLIEPVLERRTVSTAKFMQNSEPMNRYNLTYFQNLISSCLDNKMQGMACEENKNLPMRLLGFDIMRLVYSFLYRSNKYMRFTRDYIGSLPDSNVIKRMLYVRSTGHSVYGENKGTDVTFERTMRMLQNDYTKGPTLTCGNKVSGIKCPADVQSGIWGKLYNIETGTSPTGDLITAQGGKGR